VMVMVVVMVMLVVVVVIVIVVVDVVVVVIVVVVMMMMIEGCHLICFILLLLEQCQDLESVRVDLPQHRGVLVP
jgi:hypothetical protein